MWSRVGCPVCVLPMGRVDDGLTIAEESGVEMPSFFGYMKYSLLVLFPVFLVVTWIFF